MADRSLNVNDSTYADDSCICNTIVLSKYPTICLRHMLCHDANMGSVVSRSILALVDLTAGTDKVSWSVKWRRH
jgi:hypothetical protein